MRFSLTSDANWESKIEHAVRPLDLEAFFELREYGLGLSNISVVLMCRDPDLKFRQRIRYSQADSHISMDVMLSLPELVAATHSERRRIIAAALANEVPRIIVERRVKNFDVSSFVSDLKQAVSDQLLGPDASRYDMHVLERATGH